MNPMTWQTAYAIAGLRHQTKMGEEPLTKNAFIVLEHFATNEAQEAVAAAWGYTGGLVIPAGNA